MLYGCALLHGRCSQYPLKSKAFPALQIAPGDPIVMALIQFTRNHTDHSTDKGYQFEFFCDRCGNGFMSEFKASAVGLAASALRTAGGLFGGLLGSAGSNTYEIERAVRGPAHDSAFREAVEEAKT